MSTLSGVCFQLGLGVAIGMLAGTTGTRGSARGGMTLLVAAVSLLLGFVFAGHANLGAFIGALLCLLGAVYACLVISDLIASTRRPGPLSFLVLLAVLLVFIAVITLPELVILALVGLVWLAASGRGSRHGRTEINRRR